jgi:hypothetical protein
MVRKIENKAKQYYNGDFGVDDRPRFEHAQKIADQFSPNTNWSCWVAAMFFYALYEGSMSWKDIKQFGFDAKLSKALKILIRKENCEEMPEVYFKRVSQDPIAGRVVKAHLKILLDASRFQELNKVNMMILEQTHKLYRIVIRNLPAKEKADNSILEARMHMPGVNK